MTYEILGAEVADAAAVGRALCYFQPINIGDGETGRASPRQLRDAASALIYSCGLQEPFQGGIARNIGMYRNFWSSRLLLLVFFGKPISPPLSNVFADLL